MDEDLDTLSHAQLIAEAARLRHAIRRHRNTTGHELCWHHPDLWSLLPDATPAAIAVPAWPQFMRGCIKYRQSLDEQAPHAPRTDREFDSGPVSEAELDAKIVHLESRLVGIFSPQVGAALASYRGLVPRLQAELTASSRDVALAKTGALLLVQAMAQAQDAAGP
jgi:hypothetical protein